MKTTVKTSSRKLEHKWESDGEISGEFKLSIGFKPQLERVKKGNRINRIPKVMNPL
jgi:hypothetical protein